MKTEDILNIDCREQEGRDTLNRFLWKIKPVTKLGVPKGCILSIEDLEKVLHGISIRYGYTIQGIQPYYEDNQRFVFFSCGVMKLQENTKRRLGTWIGTVYGITLWEAMAKIIVKIYGDIMERRKSGKA